MAWTSLTMKFTTSFPSAQFDWQQRNEIAKFIANFGNFKRTLETVYQKFYEMCCNKGTGKRGHIVADTLLPMMFLGLRKLGNICCGHKMFLNKIRTIFCVPDTKFLSATTVACAGKRGNICVGNNVCSFARALMLLLLRWWFTSTVNTTPLKHA